MAQPAPPRNPFEYREPLLPGANRGILVERARPMRMALEHLRRGGFLTVSAPPRSGVTTFLHALRVQLPRSVYLDLANLAFSDHPPREAARVLSRTVAGLIPGLDLPKNPNRVTDILAVAAAHERQKANPEPLTAVVDGFDAWPDEAARKLVLDLRAAYTESRTGGDTHGGISVITGSSADLRDLTASGRTSPLNLAQNLFLPDLTASESAGVLRRGLQGVFPESEIETWANLIVEWTSGHPALTQMAGGLAFEHTGSVSRGAKAWSEALPEARERATDLLGTTLGVLRDREDLRRAAADIYSGMAVPFDRIHRPIRELLHLGLICANERGFCRPRNLLYEQALAAALDIGSAHQSGSLWPASPTTTTPPFDVAQGNSTPPFEGGEKRGASSTDREAASPTHEAIGIDGGSTSFPRLVGAHDSTTDPTPMEEALKRDMSVPRRAAVLQPPPAVQAGVMIGGCRIVRRIGKGAMAEVYLARHLALDTDVALKILRHPGQHDRRIAQRFLREARAAAQLSHENIVQIRNVGRDGEYQFIEMEYLAGGSLAERLKEAPFQNITAATGYLRGAAAGIQAAHAKGIIHRDLKPDNLMLTREGKIKVVDFGLAAVITLEGSRLTQEGTILGTPHYMAPEQWEGRLADERSDLYSLGATFYHLLAGRTPFEGKNAVELISNYSAGRLAPLEEHNPAVPKRLSQTLLKLLEKNPADRFGNVEELLEELKDG